ncbi:MAG: hypothetical protein ACI9XO_000955 [Paraglaciecola sp.]
MEKLELIRVGFYPDSEGDVDNFAVFDYSLKIDGEYGNYVLVIMTNEKGQLSHLTWES